MDSIVCIENRLTTRFAQLDTRYDHVHNMLWTFMNPAPRPCFNEQLLTSIARLDGMLSAHAGTVFFEGKRQNLDYAVFASRVPGIFNLGGDLNRFRECIIARDREALAHYAKLCIDVIWGRLDHFHGDTTTISLVQGQALGGGMESALAADIIVAERSAKMGLPEILFNLFPGMGALSLLARRVGLRKAETLALSGRVYRADELFEMGVVDILAEDGAGEHAVYRWVAQNSKMRNGYRAVQQAKNAVHPVTRKELTDITDIWVDAALRLTERDLKMMDRLVRAQNKLADANSSPLRSDLQTGLLHNHIAG